MPSSSLEVPLYYRSSKPGLQSFMLQQSEDCGELSRNLSGALVERVSAEDGFDNLLHHAARSSFLHPEIGGRVSDVRVRAEVSLARFETEKFLFEF